VIGGSSYMKFKATCVQLDTRLGDKEYNLKRVLESIEKTVKERFRLDVAEKNFAVIKEAYTEAKQE
ncbi:MAG: hypothetical protein N3E52_06605, partial [Candidatus Bathyarchaeota archaeon]|nr:hypothetical protein [Candidatus Bathyarchaeota archaeon]